MNLITLDAHGGDRSSGRQAHDQFRSLTSEDRKEFRDYVRQTHRSRFRVPFLDGLLKGSRADFNHECDLALYMATTMLPEIPDLTTKDGRLGLYSAAFNALRRNFRQLNGTGNGPAGYNLVSTASLVDNVESLKSEREELQFTHFDTQAILRELPDRQHIVAKLLFDGHTAADIARQLRVTRSAVSQTIKRMRAPFSGLAGEIA